MAVYGILISLLIGAVITDIRGHRIPNWLTGSAVLAGIAYHTGAGGASGFMLSIAGLGLGLALLLPFYAAGGMGAGDVKLMGAVGVLLGMKAVFAAFVASALVGGAYAVTLLAMHGGLKETICRYRGALTFFCVTGSLGYIAPPSKQECRSQLCYGAAIAGGTLLSVAKELYGL
jgi:prepilin peptidase CpaA